MQGRLGWFCSCLIVQKIHKPDCPPRPQYPLSTLCLRPKVVRSTSEGEARFEVSGNVDGESDKRENWRLFQDTVVEQKYGIVGWVVLHELEGYNKFTINGIG